MWPAGFTVSACDDFFREAEDWDAASLGAIFSLHFGPGDVEPYVPTEVRCHQEHWRQIRHTDPAWLETLRATNTLWSVLVNAIPSPPKWPREFTVSACDAFFLEVENGGADTVQEIFNRHFRPHGFGPRYAYSMVYSHLERWRQFRQLDPAWRESLRERNALWLAVMQTVPGPQPQRNLRLA